MDAWLVDLLRTIDPYLMGLFFVTTDPVFNFFIGSFALAAVCVLVGEATLALAVHWNRRHIAALTEEIRQREALSVHAYEIGDRTSYKALNTAANDAWGRHFFTMAACSAGALWPVPFALGWMQLHFSRVEFLIAPPFSLIVGETVGFAFSFIPIYILCRLLFRYCHPILRRLSRTFRG